MSFPPSDPSRLQTTQRNIFKYGKHFQFFFLGLNITSTRRADREKTAFPTRVEAKSRHFFLLLHLLLFIHFCCLYAFFYWRTWWRSIADYRADDWLGSSGAIDRESGLVTLLIYLMRINDNMIVFMPKYHSAY